MELSATEQLVESFVNKLEILPQIESWREALLQLLPPSKLILDDVLFKGFGDIQISTLDMFPNSPLTKPFDTLFFPNVEERSYEIHVLYHNELAFILSLSQDDQGLCDYRLKTDENLHLAPEEKNTILLLSVLSVTRSLYVF